MKVNVSQLTDEALDFAVAKCLNPDWDDEDLVAKVTTFDEFDGTLWNFSTDWAQGGQIIEASFSKFEIGHEGDAFSDQHNKWYAESCDGSTNVFVEGPTALVAAMRCYVACRLGNEVEIPEELL